MRDSRNYSALQGVSITYLGLLGALVLSVALMGIAFIALERQENYSKTYIARSGELRLLSYAIVAQTLEVARGKDVAFTQLKESRDQFDVAVNELKNGDSTGLPPSPDQSRPLLTELDNRWKPVRSDIDTILTGRDAVISISDFQRLLEGALTQIIDISDQLARSLASNRIDPKQVYFATNQLQLAQKIDGDLKRLLNGGGAESAAAADRLPLNVSRFGKVLKGMREGDSREGIERVTISDSAGKLADLAKSFESLESQTALIVQKVQDLVRVQNAAQGVVDKADALQKTASQLLEHYILTANDHRVFGLSLSYHVLYALGFMTLVLLVVLFYVQNRENRQQLVDAEQRKQETEEQNRRNQDAILRLLDELGNLAEGDLTVQASVTEDITGAIADSVNYAIEALRDLVSTINSTSGLVAAAVQETSAIADRLAKSSEIQSRQIENASATVMQMAQSMDEVSAKTSSSAEVAEKSVGIAHEGGDRVRRTIHGMNAIREHIQDTSKRIKRLGESSQEIGDIVALINDIADQTNILALNAAIQASAAGDAGRGFAVVADEVQRLAERSSNATKRIETLVKTIQADTNEAVISMEKSTSEVVGGAGLAEKAGEALEEIEKVSAKLAELIDEISKSSGQVSEMASRVSSAMISINEITGQTAESSVGTASAIGKLNQLAQELRQSVAGFRLPD
ncbi:MAG: methyl-accepting chemotaxis protein [Candidatus Contendobacter sp.]|nr:type IV pili methyl-accepting chemotaxis transducer N-terminal domain-containing protein [Gammaproteobacteria bacterium]MCC8992817.1 methyl-accepting chemotaxis protein [Candidatus Contendobacter sp.]